MPNLPIWCAIDLSVRSLLSRVEWGLPFVCGGGDCVGSNVSLRFNAKTDWDELPGNEGRRRSSCFHGEDISPHVTNISELLARWPQLILERFKKTAIFHLI